MSCLFLAVVLTSAGLVYGQEGFHSIVSPADSDTHTGGSDSSWISETTSRDVTPGAECDRKCGGPPLKCYYHFILERYTVNSGACGNCSNGVREDCFQPQCVIADGVNRVFKTINRSLPGPSIVVCQNDTVIVDVDNRMLDLSTTIHWHGVRQKGTPYMDGVPFVTQCPIHPSDTFRYIFKADEKGTYFYHTHIGPQKLDGLQGALIIRGLRSQELHKDLYDLDLTEHVISVQDWLNKTGYYFSPGPHLPDVIQIPDAILINGRGPLFRGGSNNFVPMARFRVRQGQRYRFRFIGATSMTCLYALTIQDHNLTVITTDGGLNIKPIVVKSISINSGERYDFIFHADKEARSYYMFVENLNPFCGGPGELRQVAVLEYEGSNDDLTLPPPNVENFGEILNPPFASCDGSDPNEICVSQLVGETNAPEVFETNDKYKQYIIEWGSYVYSPKEIFSTFQTFEEPEYDRFARYTINNITFANPPSPLLTQFDDIPKSAFCSPECKNSTRENSCICTNYYSVEKDTIVDFFVVDTKNEDFNHPYHLHGYNFFVLAMGVFPSSDPAQIWAKIAEMKYNASHGLYSIKSQPMKDTVTIPAGGYAVLRVYADNPGYWFMHCHFTYHLDIGMSAVLKVGEPSSWAPPNFPRCGNFLPYV